MPQKKKTETSIRTSVPLDPSTVMNNLDFDSLEDKIRGEDILADAESRKLIEAREVKKKLDSSEVDRRMKELQDKIGRKK